MLANTLGVQSSVCLDVVKLTFGAICALLNFYFKATETERERRRVREGEQEINGYFAAWWSNDLQSANRKFIIFTVDFTAFSGDGAGDGAGAELNFHLSVSPCSPASPLPSSLSLTSLSLYGDNWRVRAILFLSLLPYRFVLRCVGPECLVYTIYSATIYPVLCKCSHRENCFLCSASASALLCSSSVSVSVSAPALLSSGSALLCSVFSIVRYPYR